VESWNHTATDSGTACTASCARVACKFLLFGNRSGLLRTRCRITQPVVTSSTPPSSVCDFCQQKNTDDTDEYMHGLSMPSQK
jgi:hypothetical protein